MKIRTFNAGVLTCTTILAGAFSAYAADHKPAVTAKKAAAPAASYNRAVSAMNASVDFSGGVMEGNGTGQIGAVGAIPVGDKYGFQIDSLYRQGGSINAGGLAGHMFYRDPTSYLAGVTTQWNNVEGRDTYRFGVETEWYMNDITLSPSLGVQHGDINDGSDGYYDVDLSYYATENLKFTANSGGFEHTFGGSARVEWQPEDNSPFSIYAMIGDSNQARTYALAGIRFHFGSEGQSLQHRNRYSDPKNIVTPLDGLIGSSYRGGNCIPPTPSPDPSPGTC